ncbi:MAG: hypothetical protein RIC55_32660 [Pirellulaceae bacterium]
MIRRLALLSVVLLAPLAGLTSGCAMMDRQREEEATPSDELQLDIETPSSPSRSTRDNGPAPFSLSPSGREIESSVGVGGGYR